MRQLVNLRLYKVVKIVGAVIGNQLHKRKTDKNRRKTLCNFRALVDSYVQFSLAGV